MEHIRRDIMRSPNTSYFICSTPRSGSWLLSKSLEATGCAGKPREYFDAKNEQYWRTALNIRSDSDYFTNILDAGCTHNLVFGAKVHWYQFENLVRKVHRVNDFDFSLLPHSASIAFPRLKYIFLRR